MLLREKHEVHEVWCTERGLYLQIGGNTKNIYLPSNWNPFRLYIGFIILM